MKTKVHVGYSDFNCSISRIKPFFMHVIISLVPNDKKLLAFNINKTSNTGK